MESLTVGFVGQLQWKTGLALSCDPILSIVAEGTFGGLDKEGPLAFWFSVESLSLSVDELCFIKIASMIISVSMVDGKTESTVGG